MHVTDAAVYPQIGVLRRQEVIRVKDPPTRSLPRYGQHQSYRKSRSLVVRHTDVMGASRQERAGTQGEGAVGTVVVDDFRVVDAQDGAVVGQQAESKLTGLLDPEPAGIVDGKPFETVCDSREAYIELLRPDVQLFCVDRPD